MTQAQLELMEKLGFEKLGGIEQALGLRGTMPKVKHVLNTITGKLKPKKPIVQSAPVPQTRNITPAKTSLAARFSVMRQAG